MPKAVKTLARRAALWAVTALAVALSGPALGQPRCAEPIEAKLAQFQTSAPGPLATEMRFGVQAQAVVARFNKEPPPSEIEADQVVFLILAGAPRSLIVFGLRGCFMDAYFIDAAWGRALLGEGV
jgi:hypothetical protein